MDKHEFLKKLERLYPSRFNVKDDSIKAEIISEYSDVLTANYRVDYQKMWEILRDEYDFSTTPPTSFFNKNLPRCRMRELEINEIDNTKSIWVKFPWAGDMPYQFEVQKNQTEADILRRYLPKNWHWNYTLNKPERNEV